MYTVKFLDNESFDKLPYNRVQTSVGVADRNSGIAYVRDTASPMDVFTAFHELEHLKGDDLDEHSSPGEDGIYYKDLGSTFVKPFQQLIESSINNPVADFVFSGANRSLPGGNKPQSPQPQQSQQPTMDAFNPSVAMAPSSPAVSEVGGTGGGNMGGGLGQGTIDKVRDLLNQRQSGFYAGRDAGSVF